MNRALIAAVVASGGCELIANIPDPPTVRADAAPGDRCTLDAECASPAPVCDTAAMRCVECTAARHCSAAAPICAAEAHTCRGCVADAECPAGVCLPDGACADAARFVYAAAAGTGEDCTSALPCPLDTAVTKLTATRDIVKLSPGTYARSAVLQVDLAGTIAGSGSTLLASGDTAYPIIRTTVDVDVIGLTLQGGPLQQGIQCASGGLRVARTTVRGGNTGIFAGTCTRLVLDRVTVTNTANYGVMSSATPIELRNSYVVNCSTTSAVYGGVVLLDVPSGTIEHTTIANNSAMSIAGGLHCANSTVTIRNIIATGNSGPGIDAACVVANSIVDAGYTTGTATMAVDPLFVSVPTGDYHVMPGSPAAALGDATAVVPYDADGEPRPRPAGSAPDVGADEIE